MQDAVLKCVLDIYQFFCNAYTYTAGCYEYHYENLVMWVYDGVVVYQSYYIPNKDGTILTRINSINIDIYNIWLLIYALAAKIFAFRNTLMRIDEYFPIDNCINVVTFVQNGKLQGKIDMTGDVTGDMPCNKNHHHTTMNNATCAIVNDKYNVLPEYKFFAESLATVDIDLLRLVQIIINYKLRLEGTNAITFKSLYVLDSKTLSEITLKAEDLIK